MIKVITAAMAAITLFFAVAPPVDRWLAHGAADLVGPVLMGLSVFFALITLARR